MNPYFIITYRIKLGILGQLRKMFEIHLKARLPAHLVKDTYHI